jgi:hypothetical protein
VAAFPETGHNVVGNGSLPPQPWNKSVFDLKVGRQKLKGLDPAECAQVRQADEDAREALASKRELHVPNPLNALRIICQPDAAALLAFNSMFHGTAVQRPLTRLAISQIGSESFCID